MAVGRKAGYYSVLCRRRDNGGSYSLRMILEKEREGVFLIRVSDPEILCFSSEEEWQQAYKDIALESAMRQGIPLDVIEILTIPVLSMEYLALLESRLADGGDMLVGLGS